MMQQSKNIYGKTSIQLSENNRAILSRDTGVSRQQKVNKCIDICEKLFSSAGSACDDDPVFIHLKREYIDFVGVEF